MQENLYDFPEQRIEIFSNSLVFKDLYDNLIRKSKKWAKKPILYLK